METTNPTNDGRRALLFGAGTAILGAGVGFATMPVLRRLRPGPIPRPVKDQGLYGARLDLFYSASGRPDLVMVGDSITANGLWDEWLAPTSVLNRGIASDDSAGILSRISEITERQPKVVCLLIGTNDLRYGRDPADVAADIATIVALLRNGGAEVINVTVPFTAAMHVPDINGAVSYLNLRIESISTQFGNEIIDLNGRTRLGSSLDPQYSFDGLHLNAAGFRAWLKALRPLLSRMLPNKDSPSSAQLGR